MSRKQNVHRDYAVRLNRVTNHVANNVDQTHSVADLAAIANLSSFHFHRIYKAFTGETLHQMVTRLRLEAAASALLYNPELSVTQVAMNSGYSSSANFTKAFSRHFGSSPSLYRKDRKIGKDLQTRSPDTVHADQAVTLATQPELRLAYLRRRGDYLHEQIGDMHMQVQHWVDQNGCAAEDAASIGITWSDSFISDVDNWTYDACMAVQPETQGAGAVGVQTLAGGLVAELQVELAADASHDLSPHWDWLVRDWFMASDYELRPAPAFERYLPTENFVVQLCLPIALRQH